MCGILGFIKMKDSGINNKLLLENVEKMFLTNETRGKDSTGFAYVTPEGTVKYFKIAEPAKKFVEMKTFKKLEKEMPNVFIGHTRQYTKGLPSNNLNNHPIVSKKSGMALVHNGMVSNDTALATRFDIKQDAEVDSEIILRMVEHYMEENDDIIKAIQKALGELCGSITFALIYKGDVYLYGGGCTVTMAYDNENDIVYFSSEDDVFDKILPRKQKHCFWLTNGSVCEPSSKQLIKISRNEVKIFDVPKPPSSYSYSYDYNRNGYWEGAVFHPYNEFHRSNRNGETEWEDYNKKADEKIIGEIEAEVKSGDKSIVIADICPYTKKGHCDIWNVNARSCSATGKCTECKWTE